MLFRSLEVVEGLAKTALPEFLHAVSTRPDASKGEALVLFTTAPELRRDQLLAAARAMGTPELAVPRIIHTIKEIPSLGTGKTDYVTLKQLAEENNTHEEVHEEAEDESVAA